MKKNTGMFFLLEPAEVDRIPKLLSALLGTMYGKKARVSSAISLASWPRSFLLPLMPKCLEHWCCCWRLIHTSGTLAATLY